MVILFLHERVHNRGKADVFQAKSCFLPGLPPSTFFPAFSGKQKHSIVSDSIYLPYFFARISWVETSGGKQKELELVPALKQ